MISDIGFKSANMFKDSNEMFERLEATFDPESMIRHAQMNEGNININARDGNVGGFHHKDTTNEAHNTNNNTSMHDLDKMKEQNAIETMRLKMETLREVGIKKKLYSM